MQARGGPQRTNFSSPSRSVSAPTSAESASTQSPARSRLGLRRSYRALTANKLAVGFRMRNDNHICDEIAGTIGISASSVSRTLGGALQKAS